MELGAFSISLAVSDLEASRSFYETLGFAVSGGDAEQNYLILRNGGAIIGLFHGMFEKNILTFNPGYTQGAEETDIVDDVRSIRQRLVEAGVIMNDDLDPDGDGPAHIAFEDPDGNPILIDQFF